MSDFENFKDNCERMAETHKNIAGQLVLVEHMLNKQLLEPDKELINCVNLLNTYSHEMTTFMTNVQAFGSKAFTTINSKLDDIITNSDSLTEYLDERTSDISDQISDLSKQLTKIKKALQPNIYTSSLDATAKYIIDNAKTEDGKSIKNRNITIYTVKAIINEYLRIRPSK